MRHRQKPSLKSVAFNRYTVKEVHESAIFTIFKSLRDNLKGDFSVLTLIVQSTCILDLILTNGIRFFTAYAVKVL